MSSYRLTDTQESLDAVVTEWPDVRAKQVFGHRGYVHSGSMFGFCTDDGLAVRVWPGENAGEYTRE